MDNAQLIDCLHKVKNAKRIYRENAARFLVNHPEHLGQLMSIVTQPKHGLHIKAAWVLELVALKNNDLIIEHLPNSHQPVK